MSIITQPDRSAGQVWTKMPFICHSLFITHSDAAETGRIKIKKKGDLLVISKSKTAYSNMVHQSMSRDVRETRRQMAPVAVLNTPPPTAHNHQKKENFYIPLYTNGQWRTPPPRWRPIVILIEDEFIYIWEISMLKSDEPPSTLHVTSTRRGQKKKERINCSDES